MPVITLYGSDRHYSPYRFDPYDKRNFLGEGGMGRVFKGIDAQGYPIAIKVLFADLANNASIVERSIREGDIRFKHPNIIEMLDCCIADGKVHVMSRFVMGKTIDIYARSLSGNITDKQKTIITHMQSILDALSVLHEKGIVHRDVKPNNIMVKEPDNVAVLMDFGIARITGGKRLTRSGVGPGSIEYAPPEQIRGETDKIDARTDIYAFGISLYELLTGSLPYTAKSEKDIQNMHIEKPLPRHPALSAEVFRVLKKATAKEPFQRYHTALELKEELMQVFVKKNWLERLFSINK